MFDMNIDPTIIIDIPDNAKRIIYYLRGACHHAYIVGGCVRDSLLGMVPHDWDICTSAKPDRIREILRSNGIKTIETGLQHGTLTACMDGGNYEITTFRLDGKYTDNRRPDTVKFVDNIFEDLSRRDFTINAMAYSNTVGLIDPWNGKYDLHAGRIRCVHNPDDRFREDALRIMRALRFASTYGFKIEEETAAAIHRNKDLLKNISAERIRDELCKMLCGMRVLDILLEYSDVMAVIIPEIKPCIGFNQNNKYHKYTVYDHIVHAVGNFEGTDISVKMALLLHDIGKPECYTEDHNGGHFHGHSIPSARIAEDVMKRLKFDNKTTEEVVNLVKYHDSDIQPHSKAIKRWLNKIGYDLFGKLICVRIADIGAHSEINQESRRDKYFTVAKIATTIVKEQQCFTIKDLAVNGRDIMTLHVPEGPVVGHVLKHLLNKVIAEETANEHDALMEEAKYYVSEGSHYQFCMK